MGRTDFCEMFIREEKLFLDWKVGGGTRGGHVRWTRKVVVVDATCGWRRWWSKWWSTQKPL
jgi:hypothetical protein